MTEKLSVVEAMAAVMAEVREVGKGDFHNSPTAKFHFRGIDAVVNAVGPALRKHHVVVVPQLQSIDHRDVQTSGGKASRETTVLVKYVWTGPDGSSLEAIVPGEAMDTGDKGTAKAMSVAFRIALLQALCLPTDDADPDSQSYERADPPQRQAPTVAEERAALGALCTQRGWDTGIVAAKYEAKAKHPLGDATDPGLIGKFREYLLTLPHDELLATNGAQA